MKKLGRIFVEGLYLKNPVFGLFIGLTLVVLGTTTLFNAVVIGVITSISLIITETIVSLFRKHLDYFVSCLVAALIAAMVTTICSFLLSAFYPTIGLEGYSEFTNTLLTSFLPFASCSFIYLFKAKQALQLKVDEAIVDSIASSLGFILALALIAVVREILATGEIVFTFTNNVQGYVHLWDFTLPIFGEPFGGLLFTGLFSGLHQCIVNRYEETRHRLVRR